MQYSASKLQVEEKCCIFEVGKLGTNHIWGHLTLNISKTMGKMSKKKNSLDPKSRGNSKIQRSVGV